MFFFLEKYASFKLWHKLKYNIITKYCYFFFFQQNHINKTAINEKKTGTLARPWKLKVRTYSPFLVSLCRTRNTPCPMWPCCRTSWAASSRDSVPWNHGYSRNICSTCVSSLPESTKQKHKWLMWNSQVYMGFLLALTRGLTLQLNL